MFTLAQHIVHHEILGVTSGGGGGSVTNLDLPYTTSSAIGVINAGTVPWMHNFTNPTGFTDASVDSVGNARNLFLGFMAGNFTIAGTGTQGKANIGLGHFALSSLTTGSQNVAVGWDALLANTTGNYNLALGSGTLQSNVSGNSNAAIGAAAMTGSTGNNNVGIGDAALFSLTTGNQNTFIGSEANVTSGAFSNAIGIGYQASVDASNKTVIGNTSTTTAWIYGALFTLNGGPATPVVTGSGTTDRYPIWTDGANGVIGDGSIYNTIGNVIVDGATLRVENGSAGQLRLQNSIGQVLDFSVDNNGLATIDAAGVNPQITFADRVNVINDASTTLSVRRATGGGTNGIGIVAGATGTTISIVADTGPRTGLVIQQSAAWASGKMLDFQNELGTSRFNIDAATGAVGYHTASTAGTALADFGNNSTAAATGFVIGLNIGVKWGATSGSTFLGVAAATCAGYFNPTDSDSTSGGVFTALIAGGFENRTVAISRNHTEIYGAVFRAVANWQTGTTGAHGNIYGWRVRGIAANSKPGPTATALYGGYIDNLAVAATPATPSAYGLYIEEQTRGTSLNNGIFLANATTGRKLLVLGDQAIYITGVNTGTATMELASTTINHACTNLGFYGVAGVARPSAYNQTAYSTATKTIANVTATALTDNSGGTANTTVQSLTNPADAPADADALRDDLVANLIPELRNNYADLAAQINFLIADLANVKQTLNATIDDHQALGLFQ